MNLNALQVISSPEELGFLADSMRDYAMKNPLDQNKYLSIFNSSNNEKVDCTEEKNSGMVVMESDEQLNFIKPFSKMVTFDKKTVYEIQCIFYQDFPKFGDTVQVSLIRSDRENIEQDVVEDVLRQFFKDYNTVMMNKNTPEYIKVFLNVLNKDMRYHDGNYCTDPDCGH